MKPIALLATLLIAGSTQAGWFDDQYDYAKPETDSSDTHYCKCEGKKAYLDCNRICNKYGKSTWSGKAMLGAVDKKNGVQCICDNDKKYTIDCPKWCDKTGNGSWNNQIYSKNKDMSCNYGKQDIRFDDGPAKKSPDTKFCSKLEK